MTWVVGLALRYRKPNMDVFLRRTEWGSSSFRRIVITLGERRTKTPRRTGLQGLQARLQSELIRWWLRRDRLYYSCLFVALEA
jgi:hypothetical protein